MQLRRSPAVAHDHSVVTSLTIVQLEDVEEVALETSTQVYTSEQQAFELTACNGGQVCSKTKRAMASPAS